MIAATSSLMERVYLMPKPGTDRLISAISAIFVGVRGTRQPDPAIARHPDDG